MQQRKLVWTVTNGTVAMYIVRPTHTVADDGELGPLEI